MGGFSHGPDKSLGGLSLVATYEAGPHRVHHLDLALQGLAPVLGRLP